MRIAIDARASRVRSGLGRYATELVKALAEVDSENDYFVFAPSSTFCRFGDLEGRRNWSLVAVEHKIGDSIWEWLHLPRMLRHRGIEVLHATAFIFPTTVTCATVVTIHDMCFLDYPDLLSEWEHEYLAKWTAIAARCADAIITDSDATRERCMTHYDLPEDVYTTIHLAAGREFMPDAERANDLQLLKERLGLSGRYLLHVGEMVPRKNVPRLLEACHLGWSTRALEQTLVLAGAEQGDGIALAKRIGELGVNDRVLRLGHVADDALPALYRQADLAVCVSLDEGFGLPAVEAMKSGTALVVSDRPCFREVCGPRAALFVDPLDVQSIWDGIATVVNDAGLSQDLRAAGLRRSARFDWLSTAQRTLAVYEEAVQRREARRFQREDMATCRV